MTGARRARHSQPAPRRWGWLVAIVGVSLAATGGWLEYSDRPVAADPSILASAPPTQHPSSVTKKKPKPTASKPTSKRPTVPPKPAPGRPQRISVPKLEVSASVIGIKADGGSLTPPSNPRVVGWWSDGAKPGAKKGSAVITGHTVHNGGGAFDDLDQLTEGDEVIVITDNGPLRYTVDSVTTYRKAALAKHAAEVFDQNVAGRLVLITCEDWNGSVYLSNEVVVAHRGGGTRNPG